MTSRDRHARLRAEACHIRVAQATRQPAACTDVTVSFSKSISVLHASIRENARRARLAGEEQAATYWSGREERYREILHRVNRAALKYLQEWAGVTRTGYHGVRVDGQEPGRFEGAGLIVTSWLQSTSRDGDPQDHIHLVIGIVLMVLNYSTLTGSTATWVNSLPLLPCSGQGRNAR
jgi:hypothetical protein